MVHFLGTGSVWPDIKHKGRFLCNYSEYRLDESGKQRQCILFAWSDDLIHWYKFGDDHIFWIDERIVISYPWSSSQLEKRINMTIINLINYSGQRWNLKRYQPTLFLADENEIPFSIPKVDGDMILCDTEGRDLVQLHARWRIPSFGEVTLVTGKLQAAEKPYNLNLELAKDRLYKIEQKQTEWIRKGFTPSKQVLEDCEHARRILSFVDPTEESVNARWADLSLSLSMPAGEMLAMEYADWGIEQRKNKGGFSDFLLGANFYYYPIEGTLYETYYEKLFNYGTLPFYWSMFEPQKGHHNWQSTNQKLNWLKKRGMKVKGHPLYWAHTVPDWIDARNLPQLKERIRERIAQVVGYYQGRIEYWDVINEIQHYLKYRITEYTSEEAIELTRLCSEATKLADPNAQRIVNADDPFGEYMAWKPDSGFAPLEYFEELERNQVDYDIIGIQLYYGGGFSYCRDLFEISRYFDRYEKFGKELHLTETATPSGEGEDPFDGTHPQQPVDESEKADRDEQKDYGEPWEKTGRYWKASDAGFWHEPWSQRNQADWIEGFFKVLMGKPFVKAITWWDFCDAYRHFWNYPGFLDEEMKPKESYYRLLELKKHVMNAREVN